jgi:dTDP-4-dehydrorhamnose 3,5-epimerase
MKFHATPIKDAYVVEPTPVRDERGFFGRVWCQDEFAQQGLTNRVAQINTGMSERAGTLRGMHYQLAPHAEAKVVYCTRGAVFDVVVDLRPDSPSFRRWHAVELTEDNYLALYVPAGCAHGYLTLSDRAVLTYLTSERYAPTAAKGVRYDDPAFGIEWPRAPQVISKADAAWPSFQ